MAKIGRPLMFKNSVVVSTRFDACDYRLMQEIAALESSCTGRMVSAQDLIRDACNFVYRDGDKLREVFRRTRQHFQKKA